MLAVILSNILTAHVIISHLTLTEGGTSEKVAPLLVVDFGQNTEKLAKIEKKRMEETGKTVGLFA